MGVVSVLRIGVVLVIGIWRREVLEVFDGKILLQSSKQNREGEISLP